MALLRSEAQTAKTAVQTKAVALEERVELLQGDMTVLAQELAKGGSSHHLLQLEVVQLRSQLEDQCRERGMENDGHALTIRELSEHFEAHESDTRASLQVSQHLPFPA